MADNLRISDLNELNENKGFNELVVNSKINDTDTGVTKKIKVDNLLPDNSISQSQLKDNVVADRHLSNTADGGSYNVFDMAAVNNLAGGTLNVYQLLHCLLIGFEI